MVFDNIGDDPNLILFNCYSLSHLQLIGRFYDMNRFSRYKFLYIDPMY